MRKFLVLTVIISILAVSRLFSAEHKWEYINGVFHHTSEVQEARISEDGKYFYTIPSYLSDVIYKFDMTTGALVDSVVFQTQIKDTINKPRYIKFSRDAKTFLVFNYYNLDVYQLCNGEIRDINTGDTLTSFTIKLSKDDYLPDYLLSNIDYIYDEFQLIYADQINSSGPTGDGDGKYQVYSGEIYFNNVMTNELIINKCYPIEYVIAKNFKSIFFNHYMFTTSYDYYEKEYDSKSESFLVCSNLSGTKKVFQGIPNAKKNKGFLNPTVSIDETTYAVQTDTNMIKFGLIDFDGLNYKLVAEDSIEYKGNIIDLRFYNNDYLIILGKKYFDKGYTLSIIDYRSKLIASEVAMTKFDNFELEEFDYISIIDVSGSNVLFQPSNSNILYKYNIFISNQEKSAYFEVSDTILYEGESIKIYNKSNGQIDKYLWDFGDGETSNEKNPIHIYNKVGLFSISLTVYSGTDSLKYTKYEQIKVIYRLKANFSNEMTKGIDSIYFKPKNLSLGDITNYSWQINEHTIQGKEPQLMLFRPGKYDVTLIITDGHKYDTLIKPKYLEIKQSDLNCSIVDVFQTFNDSIYNLKATDLKVYNDFAHFVCFSKDTFGIYRYIRTKESNLTDFESFYFSKNKNIKILDIEIFDDNRILLNSLYSKTKINKLIYENSFEILDLKKDAIYSYVDNTLPKNSKFFSPCRIGSEIYFVVTGDEPSSSVDLFLTKIDIDNKSKLHQLTSIVEDKYSNSSVNIIKSVSIYDTKQFSILNSFASIYNFREYLGEHGQVISVTKDGYYNNNILQINFPNILDKTSVIQDKDFFIKEFDTSINLKSGEKFFDDCSWYNTFVPNKIINVMNYFIANDFNNKFFLIPKNTTKEFSLVTRGFSAVSIAPYNDSLFLAGGHSANGKAALYYVKYPEITPVDSIIFNSLYGNIVDIEVTNSGDYILLAENLIAGEKDGLVVFKTRNIVCDINDKNSTKQSHSLSILTNGPLSIPVESPDATITELKLFNSLGEMVMNIPLSKLQIDNNSISFDLRELNIPDLQTYFYNFSSNNQKYYGKFIYIK